jgi:hypothetical protein
VSGAGGAAGPGRSPAARSGPGGRPRLAAVLGLVGALALAQPAGACRLALALGLDVSASVDPFEYRLQYDGLAGALRDPSVRAAFFDRPEGLVALAVFEWSGPAYQRQVVDWTQVDHEERLDEIAARLEREAAVPAKSTTAIGAAMLFAGRLFARGPACGARTLDLSGDGPNNDGIPPQEARRDASLRGVTINALAIGADLPPDHALNPNRSGVLTRYFEMRVIQGTGAFVETATDYRDFARAIRRKLLRELDSRAVVEAVPMQRGAVVLRVGLQ